MSKMMLKASLFALGLSTAIGSFTASQSYAQDPDIYFYPAKSWTVGLSETNAGMSGERHCAIQSEFNNGFIIQFDGSNEWVESFSINFRQSVFNKGESYDVALRIPGKKSRSLTGVANKDNVLTLSFKGQKDIYKAIRSSSVLDLNIADNEFRFYLVGFANAAQGFERCMAGGAIKPPARDKKGKVQLADKAHILSNENDLSSHTVNEAIAYEDSEIQNIPLTEILPDLPEVNIAEIEAVPPEDSPAFLGKARTSRKRMSETLSEEIQRNPNMIADDVEILAAQEDSVLLPEIDLTHKDEEKLVTEPKNEKKESFSSKIKTTKELYKAQADFTMLGEVEPAASDSRVRLSGDVVGRISKLEATIQALEKENRDLNDELRAALQEGRQERLDVSSNNWNLERATMRFNEAERQIKRLGQQLQKERAQCSTQKTDLEAMLFDPKVTNERQLARLADLEQQLAAAKEKQNAQRLRYEERIRILEAQ